jgi:hypothetical protein
MLSWTPPNSLARLHALARDVAARQVLGTDVVIEIYAYDERHTEPNFQDRYGRERLRRERHRLREGVELGQAIAICLVLPIMFVIGRLAHAVLVYRYASLAVAAAGVYWLVERIHLE